jgi:hypothetical protein
VIKVNAGKSIIEYAAMVGDTTDAVVKWVSTYINSPSESQLRFSPNSTPQSRALEIKEYIEMRLNESVKYRIEEQIMADRIRNAKTVENVAECPF